MDNQSPSILLSTFFYLVWKGSDNDNSFFLFCCCLNCYSCKILQVAYFYHKQLHFSRRLNVFCYFFIFLHYAGVISDRSDLFSKSVVMVWRNTHVANLAPWLLPSLEAQQCACIASMLLLLRLIRQSLIVQDKLLHAPFTGWLLIYWRPDFLTWCVT